MIWWRKSETVEKLYDFLTIQMLRSEPDPIPLSEQEWRRVVRDMRRGGYLAEGQNVSFSHLLTWVVRNSK